MISRSNHLDKPNMTLPDEHTRLVNTLGKAEFEDLSLQPALQEIFDFQSQHVIETHTSLVEHADADKTTDECIAFKKTFGVLRVELQQLTSGTSDF